MENIVYLIIAFGLVLLNGFFVAAEFAMVKLRQTRIKSIQSEYGKRGKILAEINSNLDTYLSACQLGITIASIGLGWIGEPAFSHLVEPLLTFFGISSPTTITVTSFAIAFFIVSYLHIVIGELMPKSLAIRQSERISLLTALPLYGFYWLMYPAIWILNISSNFLLHKTGLDAVNYEEHIYSPQEIKLVLKASHVHGRIADEEAEIIEHVLDINNLKITDIMSPVEELVSLPLDIPIDQNLKVITTKRYSRYPAYQGQLSNMVGIIHIKDLFAAKENDGTLTDFKKLLRPVLKAQSSLSALDLLRHLRQGNFHFALVYHDEALIGFVTLDKTLSFLFGEISDEFHGTGRKIKRVRHGNFILKGSDSLYALEKALDIELSMEEDIRTVGGLVLYKLGYLPPEGTSITFEKFKILVTKVKGSRIIEVKIYPL